MTFAVIDPATHRTTGAHRGFKRNADGTFIYPIIAPGDNKFTTLITGLNELGMMCGYNTAGFNQLKGFLYDGAKFTVVDYMPEGSTTVRAINNRNHYAGSFGPNGGEYGFLVADGKFTQFVVPGALATLVYGLAWDDTMVGYTYVNDLALGFLRGPAGRFRTFAVEGERVTVPYAINNNVGLIAGSYLSADGREHGFIYDYVHDQNPGPIVPVTTIDFPEALDTRINSINADGVIVGTMQIQTSDGSSYRQAGFIGYPR